MMKKRRIHALLLTLVLLLTALSLVGCGKDGEAPDGMMSVTCAGANYRLFVPENWTPKTGSGISGAFVTLKRLSDVSAYQKNVPAGTTAEQVWEECLADYTRRYPNVEIVNRSENAMGGLVASVYVFDVTRGEEVTRCMQVSAVSDKTDIAYIFLYTATPEMYDSYIDQIFEIVSQILVDQAPYSHAGFEPAAPEHTPAGMICISDKKVAYLFFVPENWRPDTATEIVDAQAPGDPSNVSLTVFIEESVTDPAKFREMLEASYAAEGYTIGEITETDTTMGGIEGKTFTYDLTVNGDADEIYRLSQTVVVRDEFLFGPTAYVLTCTSTPDLFDAHAAEFDAMRDAFAFRK